MKKLLLIGFLLCGTAHAKFISGNKLLNDMNDETYYLQGAALGYILGVADATEGIVHCMPSNVSAGQLNDLVKKYLVNTPQYRHYTADVLVSYVLSYTWPCKKGSGT